MTEKEKKAKAKELRHSGLSYRELGQRLGINEGTAYNYVNELPLPGEAKPGSLEKLLKNITMDIPNVLAACS